jgi:uncharacterized protein with FMN-binding domain
MIKKILLSLAVVGGFTTYALMLKQQQRLTNTPAVDADIVSPVAELASPTPTIEDPTPSPVSIPTPTPTPVAASGKYKNGTYTGQAFDVFYGNIQVKATISGGKITDVQFLQYPNDRDHSIEVNQYAMPILKQEAIQAQSAEVDTVSGATDSSRGFNLSLQSALDKAS